MNRAKTPEADIGLLFRDHFRRGADGLYIAMDGSAGTASMSMDTARQRIADKWSQEGQSFTHLFVNGRAK